MDEALSGLLIVGVIFGLGYCTGGAWTSPDHYVTSYTECPAPVVKYKCVKDLAGPDNATLAYCNTAKECAQICKEAQDAEK